MRQASTFIALGSLLALTASAQDIPFGPQTQSNIIVNTLSTFDGESQLVENGVLNAIGQWTLVENDQGVFTFTDLPPILNVSLLDYSLPKYQQFKLQLTRSRMMVLLR